MGVVLRIDLRTPYSPAKTHHAPVLHHKTVELLHTPFGITPELDSGLNQSHVNSSRPLAFR